jgi:pimeloyl-ACP methyl ester carboxylesterase
VPAARPTVVGLLCLLLAACTGGGGKPEAPAAPSAPSLRLTVASVPLSCQAVPGAPEGCQVGGSGAATGLGTVRVYHSVRLGLPRPGGCREATTTGSLNGATWSAPFSAGGAWCGQRAQFTYRLDGPSGGQGRLEHRYEPPSPATVTFTGALPAPPAAAAGFSAGGGVTARVACELAGRVAAVAAVAAALFTEPVECRPSRPIAVLSMHGTADEVLPYGGQDASVASPLPLPALPAWLGEWATRDGCPGDPAVFLDTAEVTGVRWSGCRDGTEVVPLPHQRRHPPGAQHDRRPAVRRGCLGVLRRPPAPGLGAGGQVTSWRAPVCTS